MTNSDYITGTYTLGDLEIPRVETRWSATDLWGTLKVRWSFGRMDYKVKPGLYAVGSPDRQSLVFVSANYKLSFDHLRRALEGMNAWILVINTRGINVWCAAGKGIFSTKEVVRRIRIDHLDQVVDHRRLILPQLSATGVAAHQVQKMTGFSVLFGPVKAVDIKAFVESGLKATEPMRMVTFPLKERLKVIPVDIFYGTHYLILIPALFFLLSGLSSGGYSFDRTLQHGWNPVVNLFAGYLTGCVVTPALLPWIPFRRFSLKGLLMGFLTATLLLITGSFGTNPLEILAWFLMTAGLSSFMAMNFTGSSTFTSISGVQKEMKVALPVQIALVAVGLALWIASLFITL
ncbi:MAG: mercury methylation corrinoid protein HgcA [Bacteroidales bacterium]|nr:mercury methylation corrinoid protein HgcA [Bacteroidales bacterium]